MKRTKHVLLTALTLAALFSRRLGRRSGIRCTGR